MLQLILSLILSLSLSTVSLAQTIAIDKILVIVNDKAITLSEYDTRYRQIALENNLKQVSSESPIDPEVLDLLVDERIQLIEAEKFGITITDEQVEQAVRNIADRNNLTVDQLQQVLEKDGLTAKQFRENLRGQVQVQQLIETAVYSKVRVSDQEIEHYLRTHERLQDTDEAYEISHLAISTAQKNEEQIRSDYDNLVFIHAKLVEGAPFAKAVEDYSDSNKNDGGYLGWRNRAQLPEIFLLALRATPVGQITDIIQSENGFHLLKLHDKKGGGELVLQFLIRHILIQPQRKQRTQQENEAFAWGLYDQLKNGADFESLARLHSDDVRTSAEGGLIGWVNPDDMTHEINTAISQMGINEFSEPILSPFGYHIIQVLDQREHDPSLDVAREEARQTIYTRKATARYQNWLEALKNTAHVIYVAGN